MTKNTTAIKRTFTGEVVSTKMNKTILVRIERTLVHPKYGKRYVRSKKYPVHDEQAQAKVGDKVSFRECRPYSKTKRWRLVKIHA